MTDIGDIYLPTVSELSSKNAEKRDSFVSGLGTDHIYPVEGRKVAASPILIRGYLFQKTGDPKGADDYAEDLMALEERDSFFNHINSNDTIGFINNVDVKIERDMKPNNMRKYEIKGNFFPYSLYQHGITYRGSRYDEGAFYSFPRYFVLPTGSSNVNVVSSIDVVPLSSCGSIGSVPIYRPFPFFNHSNYDSTTGSAGTDSEAMDGITVEMNSIGEGIIWSFDIGTEIPRGAYKVRFRSKATNAIEDINVEVVGSVSGTLLSTNFTCTTGFTVQESSAISLSTNETITVTISKETSDSNNIIFDYFTMNPEYAPIILFDTVTDRNVGEVKIFDSVTHGETDSSKWKRIYSLRHKYTGDIILVNNLMSWRLNPAVTWANTGDLVVGGASKKLYPQNFSSKYPNIVISDINPMYVELRLKDIGSNSMETTVIVDPIMMRFEVTKRGSFADDWKFTTSNMKHSKWQCTSSVVGEYTYITSSNSTYMFALLAEVGYTTVTYKELLFEAFNKPNLTGYIAKRLN